MQDLEVKRIRAAKTKASVQSGCMFHEKECKKGKTALSEVQQNSASNTAEGCRSVPVPTVK